MIAGDLHGLWSSEDLDLIIRINPDAVLFVGDLGEGDIAVVKEIKKIPIPVSVILGNHDHGHDGTGLLLKTQLNLLGDLDCSWSLKRFENPSFSLIGARPCSSGGGFYLSKEVHAVFGPITLEESVRRIVAAAKEVPTDKPFVILAHSGPSGLGSDFASPCGRDWKAPALDWGDKDLSLAIDKIRKIKVPDLVVFGHMHHVLRRGQGKRVTFTKDIWGTSYLNAACVPRKGKDVLGQSLCHFSWVEFQNNSLKRVSHRWYRNDATLAYEEKLLDQ